MPETQSVFEHEYKLNYRGDHTAFDPDNIVGPNVHGELLRPFHATYHSIADYTTIWYELVPKPLLPGYGEHAVKSLNDRLRLHDLFIGGGGSGA